MKTIIVCALALFVACKADRSESAARDRQAHVSTTFAEQSELFVEFPAFVRNQDSPFAAHVTLLDGYRPLERGRVTAVLSGGGAPEERFVAGKASVPGIFRPVARPQHAVKRHLAFVVEFNGIAETHDIGDFPVYPDVAAAIAAAPAEEEEGGAITYLKEQQWKTDFGLSVAAERPVRASIAANGVLRARGDGEARVAAPVAGRVLPDRFPTLGQRVRRGEALAALAPSVPEGDVATLALEVERARLRLEAARRDRARLEALLVQEAVPERRVLEARSEESAAVAQLDAAKKRLDQFRGGATSRITLTAPLSGTIVDVAVSPGEHVDAGRLLVHIVDLDRLWLQVNVPESEIGRARTVNGALFTVPGYDQPFAIEPPHNGRIIAFSGAVDPRTRTTSLIFEFPNPQQALKVGLGARVQLLTPVTTTGVVIPASAIVDDDGLPVAYVMIEGESFERRPLRLGAREGNLIQIVEGVRPGERVVSTGAYSVKLAASSTAVPAHGHAH